MKNHLYNEVVMTIIAICLVILCVDKFVCFTPVNAQGNYPNTMNVNIQAVGGMPVYNGELKVKEAMR